MISEKQLICEIVAWIRNSNIRYSTPEHIAQALEDDTWKQWLIKWKEGF